MTQRSQTEQGASLLEALFVLSIITTIWAFFLPALGEARRNVFVTACQAQLHETAAAIARYRNDHNGNVPFPLGKLSPRYVDPGVLVCPFTKRIAANDVRRLRAEFQSARGLAWTSYFAFSPKHIDDLRNRGIAAYSYSEVLAVRGGDTPLVVCRDHREPFSVNPFIGRPLPAGSDHGFRVDPASLPVWFQPEAPVLILRWDGRVSKSWKGGAKTNGTATGSAQDLVEL